MNAGMQLYFFRINNRRFYQAIIEGYLESGDIGVKTDYICKMLKLMYILHKIIRIKTIYF